MKNAPQLLEEKRDGLLAAMPQHVDRDQFYHVMLSLSRTKEIEECTPVSVMMFAYGCAKLGLMPDATLGHVYPVPFETPRGSGIKVCQLIVGYRGFIELAMRNRTISAVHAGLVREGDEFDQYVDEHGPHILHREDQSGEMSRAITHAYCIAQPNPSWGTTPMIEVMRMEQLKPFIKNTKVWREHRDEMIRKCPVKRGSKYWRRSMDLVRALEWDYQADQGIKQTIPIDEIMPESAARQRVRTLSVPPPDDVAQTNEESSSVGVQDPIDPMFKEPSSYD